jgi:RNA polymerase sigma-70 factor (ECF subfamily)
MHGKSETTRLRQFIADEAGTLLGTFRYYLYRAGMTAQPLDLAAQELLNDVVVEALQHEDRFLPGGQPRAWLLGIGANLIKRRRVELARRNRREPLVRDLYPTVEADMGEDELFDWMASVSSVETETELESNQQVMAILSRVSPEDQRVLRLAILSGLDGAALAKALGVSPGAARVRLHRALNRLREAHQMKEHRRHG